ncbi:MAG: AAA family ATPase [Saprospiraceae bacterium]
MVPRIAEKKLLELASSFKSVAVTGPHQTGKTTLVKYLFKDKPYVSFETPDFRNFALEDPRRFLQTYSNGAVLDEIQRVPDLFSYLQELLDNSSQKGLFVFSGSNNYLLQQNIS